MILQYWLLLLFLLLLRLHCCENVMLRVPVPAAEVDG
jgi:hypothetical protein